MIIPAESGRKLSTLDDDVYETILSILKGEFLVPVERRTALHLRALRHYYRYRDRLTISTEDPTQLLIGIKVHY